MKEIMFNIVILIASIFLCIMLLSLYFRFYEPYFFPNLNEDIDINNIIENNKTYSQDLLLIKGIISLDSKSNVEFDTISKNRNDYVRFFPSINKEYGNQFTYSFWFNKKNNDYSGKTLFYRGSISQPSPLVKFGQNSNELVIEYSSYKNNTLTKKNFPIEKELFNITDHNSWFMLTVVFKDYKKDNRETGIEISVYLNNALLALEKKENEILHIYNEKFVILHEASNNTVQPNLPGELADIRYFNYALSYQEIDDLYKKGFNNEVFKTYLQLNSNRSKENMYKISLFNRIKN